MHHQKKSLWLLILLVAFLHVTPVQLHAQAALLGLNKQEKEAETIPDDPLNRRTPRGTVKGFVQAMTQADYLKAAKFINFPPDLETNEEQEQIVRVLKHLLDQKGNLLPYQGISNKEEGKLDEDVDSKTEIVGSIQTDDELIDIYLTQQEDERGYPIWLFSSETIDILQSVSLDHNTIIDTVIPSILNKFIWLGVPLGQWIFAILLLAASFVLCHFLLIAIIALIKLLWRKAKEEPVSGIITALRLPLKLFVSVWLFVQLSQYVGLSIILRQRFDAITIIVGVLAILILLWRLSDYVGGFLKTQMEVRENPSGLSVILFLERAAKIAIIVFGVIAILGAFGIDVTTGIAALGIGGIALALGAQKTVENFVGSVTLIADRPIRVGDFCKVGQITGTIEKIGIRSTTIRTLDRTLVTIPNGIFSSETIENFAFRDRFRFITVLNFRYESTPDQMRYLLSEIRSVLYSHPKVFEDPARVRFVNFGAHSLDIEIFAYIDAIDYNEFLEIREDIMLRIMDVVDKSGSDFAFPSQTLYMAKDPGLSKESREQAEREVESWRNNHDMPVPKFTPEQINDLRGKITYPPEGSSSYTPPETE